MHDSLIVVLSFVFPENARHCRRRIGQNLPLSRDERSNPDLVETTPARLMGGFELVRIHPAQGAVTPRSIVERIDVVSDVGDGERRAAKRRVHGTGKGTQVSLLL
jgi:hypothetical protein